MGNSLLYYNDVPRLLEAFGGSDLFDQGVVEQDSCLRGGVDLRELLARGNGMEEKFGDNPDVRSAATAVDACICGTYQDCELEMVARWRGSRWEVAVHAVRWRLLEHQEAKDEEEQRQWYARLKEQNVSLPAVLASQLSWFPD